MGEAYATFRRLSSIKCYRTLVSQLCQKVFGFFKTNLSGAEAERRWRRKRRGERGGSPCLCLNAEAAGTHSALNRTRQKRIRRCIPARQLEPLPNPGL